MLNRAISASLFEGVFTPYRAGAKPRPNWIGAGQLILERGLRRTDQAAMAKAIIIAP